MKAQIIYLLDGPGPVLPQLPLLRHPNHPQHHPHLTMGLRTYRQTHHHPLPPATTLAPRSQQWQRGLRAPARSQKALLRRSGFALHLRLKINIEEKIKILKIHASVSIELESSPTAQNIQSK